MSVDSFILSKDEPIGTESYPLFPIYTSLPTGEHSACHPLACWFPELILRPWRWRRYVPPKRLVHLNGLHSVISQKMMLFSAWNVKIHTKVLKLWSAVFHTFFGQHFEQDHHSPQMATTSLFIANICSSIFEHSISLSYSSFTHYILAVNHSWQDCQSQDTSYITQ
jgi:hypothetical protein